MWSGRWFPPLSTMELCPIRRLWWLKSDQFHVIGECGIFAQGTMKFPNKALDWDENRVGFSPLPQASQEPLRAAASSRGWTPWRWSWTSWTTRSASQIDMAVIWVTKASKGSTQWTDDGTQRQLSHYRFRKKMKPLTVLIKTIYLGGLGGFTNLGRWAMEIYISLVILASQLAMYLAIDLASELCPSKYEKLNFLTRQVFWIYSKLNIQKPIFFSHQKCRWVRWIS